MDRDSMFKKLNAMTNSLKATKLREHCLRQKLITFIRQHETILEAESAKTVTEICRQAVENNSCSSVISEMLKNSISQFKSFSVIAPTQQELELVSEELTLQIKNFALKSVSISKSVRFSTITLNAALAVFKRGAGA
jgi:predicted dinucleotide-utilizing enzyme